MERPSTYPYNTPGARGKQGQGVSLRQIQDIPDFKWSDLGLCFQLCLSTSCL